VSRSRFPNLLNLQIQSFEWLVGDEPGSSAASMLRKAPVRRLEEILTEISHD